MISLSLFSSSLVLESSVLRLGILLLFFSLSFVFKIRLNQRCYLRCKIGRLDEHRYNSNNVHTYKYDIYSYVYIAMAIANSNCRDSSLSSLSPLSLSLSLLKEWMNLFFLSREGFYICLPLPLPLNRLCLICANFLIDFMKRKFGVEKRGKKNRRRSGYNECREKNLQLMRERERESITVVEET